MLASSRRTSQSGTKHGSYVSVIPIRFIILFLIL